MTYYSRKITMPKTKRDGLANFVQMIINEAEKGDAQEAMLKAVDLWNDIESGAYDDITSKMTLQDIVQLAPCDATDLARIEAEKAAEVALAIQPQISDPGLAEALARSLILKARYLEGPHFVGNSLRFVLPASVTRSGTDETMQV